MTFPPAPAPDDRWRAARALVFEYGWNAVAYQILNPGMQLWFSKSGDAVAGYVTFGGMRIVAGAPICHESRLADVALEFESDARDVHERAMFLGAGSRLERVFQTRGDHSLVPLGAQPTWDPHAWNDIVQHKASLRAQLHRARNKSVEVHEWTPERASTSPVLRNVLHDWLSTRGLPPLHFLTTPNLLDTLGDRRVFVATRVSPASESGEHVVGFLVGTPIPVRHGWLVEQWPRTHDAPNGTTHLLVDAAMHAFAASNAHYVTLGLAPLSDRAGDIVAGQPMWLRGVLQWVRAHGRRFYNFRGLEAFKNSLQPLHWEPIYVIVPGRKFTPMMFRAIAGAFSNGSPEGLVLRAILTAVRRELQNGKSVLQP